MTNEEYLRSALLGGIHFTNLSFPRRGAVINLTIEGDLQAALSLPESNTVLCVYNQSAFPVERRQ